MNKPQPIPFYDPLKTFDENTDKGPFGAFENSTAVKLKTTPSYTFLGYKINFPLGIAAGPLPSSKHIKGAFDMGFDVNVYKTQRTVPISANPFPNVIPIDVKGEITLKAAEKGLTMRDSFPKSLQELTITNSFGNPSRGPSFWTHDVKKAISYEGDGQLLIVSVCGTIREGQTTDEYYQDFADAAKLAADTGVKAIELNLSCPNVANEGILCYSAEAVETICKKVRTKIGDIPLIVKFGYFSNEQQHILETIFERITPYIQAVATINTISAAIYKKDGTQALPGEGRLKSGLCGAGIKWAGIDMVKRLDKLRKEKKSSFEIIGVGGVMTPEDFTEYRKAGADVVMTCTGAMWNPYLAQEIKEKNL